jgi:selenocysteine lyase/cysteine desulfurase
MGELLPRVLGNDLQVECVGGRMQRYANLDYAASAPVMTDVWNAVEAFMPWYSSVHRGSGYKSQFATAEYEGARDVVARFVGARPGDGVVFVRNTTEAINVLSASLPTGTRVLSSPVEHHANMLPWRRHDVRLLPFTSSADELLDATEHALRAERTDLLAVTGASNVTGEVWPVAELAALAHRHGAELFVDAAQLAPHRAIDMARSGIDHLALSGHKLYAPFGAGALVGRLRDGEPLLAGDVRLEPDYIVTPVSAETRSELDVPIRVGDEIWGALSVQSRHEDAYDEEDARLVAAVADVLGLALRAAP